MGYGWDHAHKLADKHGQSSSGLFVRLTNDGDKIVGIFLGEPYAREVVWTGERYERHDAENPAHRDKRKTVRIALNFYEVGAKELRIIEGGVMWFKDVMKVREKYGLERWSFEIERNGESGDPKTTYTILPEQQLSELQREYLTGLELHDLERIIAGGDTPKAPEPAEDGPIDGDAAVEILTQLKTLPRRSANAFLHHFGLARVRDLKQSQLDEARRELERLRTEMLASTDVSEMPF